jgi:hypothetical protein
MTLILRRSRAQARGGHAQGWTKVRAGSGPLGLVRPARFPFEALRQLHVVCSNLAHCFLGFHFLESLGLRQDFFCACSQFARERKKLLIRHLRPPTATIGPNITTDRDQTVRFHTIAGKCLRGLRPAQAARRAATSSRAGHAKPRCYRYVLGR